MVTKLVRIFPRSREFWYTTCSNGCHGDLQPDPDGSAGWCSRPFVLGNVPFPHFYQTLRVVCVWTGRLGGESPHVQETQVEAGRS